MNGRKLNPDVAIRTLAAKKVHFTNTGYGVIDLTKAEPLGNKSWGKLDYLTKHCGMKLDTNGLQLYRKQFIN